MSSTFTNHYVLKSNDWIRQQIQMRTSQLLNADENMWIDYYWEIIQALNNELNIRSQLLPTMSKQGGHPPPDHPAIN